jgi:6-pyruvoyltetrahydropterin/6-carboxytetrahydropterin synthase
MYRLTIKTHFDAAHYIRDYQGKCSREHGHRWNVELVIARQKLDKLNMVIDFKEAKGAINSIIDMHLDHYQLNDNLGEPNLTAEYLAKWLYEQVKARLLNTGIISVTIWESPDCGVTYYE